MTNSTTGGGASPPSSAPGSPPRPDDLDDEFLAAILIRMWSLASGRTLRADVPPDQLSAEELIAFWADDMTPRPGRHARSGAPARTVDPAVSAMAVRPTPRRRGRTRRRSFGETARDRQEHPADPAAA
jgi:hypothetical protein